MVMKSLIAGLTGVVITLSIFSCATAPSQPLGPGELRLSDMYVPNQVPVGFPYEITIIFRADGKPEISKACCTRSDGGLSCFKPKNLKYGTPGNFTIQFLLAGPGSYTMECYAEYLRDGKTQRTNVVSSEVKSAGGK
jgi:hypothetical protein